MSNTEPDKPSEKRKSKKYKKTKDLIRLAKNNGMSQKEIAKKCRTQQSTISNWLNGRSLAREDQIQPLLEIYGYKLRRKTFKVYWNFALGDDNDFRFFKVEGRIIMDHKFYDQRRSTKTGKTRKLYAKRRLIVHDQGKGKYLLLKLSRIGITNNPDDIVECSYDDAAWITEVIEERQMNKDELIKYVDTEKNGLLGELPSDAATLPYLIRQALLYAGESIDEVSDYPV